MGLMMIPFESDMYETDNRDSKETALNLGIQVRVDPQDLMLNMIQNLPVPLDERYEPIFLALCRCIESDLDAAWSLPKRATYDGFIQIVTDTLKQEGE